MKHNDRTVYAVDPCLENHTWVAEQKLARAVIVNGLREAAHSHQLCHRADALSWLLSDSIEPCSFLWWLAYLTDSPEGTADYIRRKVDLSALRTRTLVDASTPEAKPPVPLTEDHRRAISDAAKRAWAARREKARFAGIEGRKRQLLAKKKIVVGT